MHASRRVLLSEEGPREGFQSEPVGISTQSKVELIEGWCKAIRSEVERRLTANEDVPGYKLVEGRSNRKYSDQDAVAKALRDAEIPDEIAYERSLLGITAMEKAIGKKKFADVLGDLITKPEGKPTLVPEGDKRPALTSRASALDDFSKPV